MPPEALLKSTVLMAMYSIRSERAFCERLNYDLLFKWFLDMRIDQPAFDATVFTKNRKRLLEHEVADEFFAAVVRQAKLRRYVSSEHFTVDAIAGLALVTATVNTRMLLISASLYPWLGESAGWRIYPTLHILTDPGWLILMRYRARGGSDAGVFLGSSVVLAATWIGAAAVGYLLGSHIADPRRFGIDLVMPIFFAAMLVPLWRGPRRAVGWLVAGLVALIVQRVFGGWWFIVAGAVSGSVVGGLVDGDR